MTRPTTTISGRRGDLFRYLSISVPHETRCRVRDHHQYSFGTTSSVPPGPLRYQILFWKLQFPVLRWLFRNRAVLTKFCTETILVPNWKSPVTEMCRYRSSHVIPNMSFLVPKWFGTERIWYRTWPNPNMKICEDGAVICLRL